MTKAQAVTNFKLDILPSIKEIEVEINKLADLIFIWGKTWYNNKLADLIYNEIKFQFKC
jgi:hypothetical protein